ncbi:hypothetical protein ACWT_1982 [Actinoplanes sp. SE50]|uniref:glycosyl hydrolase 115 family protein n=1 Tax=unclassified Actinoplanes TaxID=2626549 RepID=UPI00023EC232|nr:MULTISPECIES: glycosyl hydrolase 115 family protein [unclassified Actinoplanes]AEV83001.1 hypothetical protein ACPL_2104 [Actinoplanes sp. SE50/110]ATO81397.1 hypothetical protein ACWT_1982 [Actinoplanes sp. SE50]SLL98804.1 hypothetical protein ACSP50_2031 [Actinoplanes sp. SE50/110]
MRSHLAGAVAVLAVLSPVPAHSPAPAPAPTGYLSTHAGPGRFPLAGAPLLTGAGDYPGVLRVAGDLRSDLAAATGATEKGGRDPIIVGTIGHSTLIDKMINAGRLDVRGIAGRWETSLEQVVDHPLPGVRRAFVIAGSDQRGTIYGAYDVSRQIGVSPWHFWDDVPVPHADALYVLPGRHSQGTPKVKYRGFFINDENPDTGTWAPGFFGPGKAPGHPGGLNANYYAKVFETMLRLKANYLWPAVWGRAFAEDDPANHATASYYGVVMGTSHEAPMMRGIEEWNRHPAGTGEWSFRRNPDAIKDYWRAGIQRMHDQDIEGVVTLGMRGNGDVGLPDGDGIDLMDSIISSQRRILADAGMLGVPQVQTLYKEVQRYWDQGYRPPDDVTVVFCDDNWGNMRKLPDPSLPARGGGYGMYYHFDYVGDGRNYKWADTVNLTNTWEQLNRAYTAGVDRLWVANVGDLKNDEEPTQFFLNYAWDPDAIPVTGINGWERRYAAENFGTSLSAPIAEVLSRYGVLQSRRKPELLNRRITVDPAVDPRTDPSAVRYDDQGNPFSLTAYREMDRVVAEWQTLAARTERIRARVPEALRDAFFQLVYYQIKATANLYELRRAEFTNIAYAAQGRAATNDLADEAEARFAEDQALNTYYNTVLAGGKWKDWQLQPKIGYGNVARYGPNAPWQQPEKNNVALPDEIYPYLKRIEVPAGASLGVALDGGDPSSLPEFSPWQAQPGQYLDVYNRGTTPFAYTITAGQPWVHVTPAGGTVTKQVRAFVTVDWRRAPAGVTDVPLRVEGAGGAVVLRAPVRKPVTTPRGFAEANGYVSIPATGFDHHTGRWRVLPGIGKSGDGITPLAAFPAAGQPGSVGDRGQLDYTMTLTSAGPVTIDTMLMPRNGRQRYAISVDGAPPQTVDAVAATGANDTTMNRQWARNTSDNVTVTATTHQIAAAGPHTVSFRALDPGVVLQRLVVDTGGVKDSYLGPPTSRRYRP